MGSKTTKIVSACKCVLFVAALFNLNTSYPAFADSTTDAISDLNSRIVALEEHIGDTSDKTDETNPGAQATKADLESLKEQLRLLQSRIDDTQRQQDELNLLREDIKLLKKENTEVRSQKLSKKEPLYSDADEEADALMQLLEKSAPGNDTDDADNLPLKKKGKDKELTAVRDAATKKAEATAPNLTAGNAQAQYNEAFALFDKGAYKEAERAFTYFIKAYPDDPLVAKAIYWKAECCFKQKNLKDAKILFVNAYKKNPSGPKAPDCLLRLGEILATQGKNEDACTAWRKLKKDFPHMTSEMKTELNALKTTYSCKFQTEEVTKPSSKKSGATAG